MSQTSMAIRRAWNKAHYDWLRVQVPIDAPDRLKVIAARHQMSLRAYVIQALDAYAVSLGEDPPCQPPATPPDASAPTTAPDADAPATDPPPPDADV